MHYTIYKVTNIINQKFYIGKHQTKNLDDGYMGSGKALKAAIKKHGIESFNKEILHIFDNEADMNAKEKELVVISEQSYNLCEGGKGGFGYINKNKLSGMSSEKAKKMSLLGKAGVEKWKKTEKGKQAQTRWNRSGPIALKEKYPEGTFKGKSHTIEAKQKISAAVSLRQSGSGNSQYGKPRSEETKQKISETLKIRRLQQGLNSSQN